MKIELKKINDFPRGTIFPLLKDAYSFDDRCNQHWSDNWKEFDEFFFDNFEIANKCGFITTLNNNPIGFVSWDPRNIPEYVQIRHNCILTKYKEYGRLQLQ